MMVDIRDSIVKLLSEKFPNHTIYDEEVKQGLKRPCFFVELIPVELSKISPNLQERSMIIDVQYMSKEDTKTKKLEMAEELGQFFNFVEFNGMKVNVSNERYEIVDRILHFMFDLDFIVIGEQVEDTSLIGKINLSQEVIKWQR